MSLQGWAQLVGGERGPEAGLRSTGGAGRRQGQGRLQATAGLGGRGCAAVRAREAWLGSQAAGEKGKIDRKSTTTSASTTWTAVILTLGEISSEHLQAQGLSFSICKMGLSKHTRSTQ